MTPVEAAARAIHLRVADRYSKGKALDQCMAYLGMHKSVNPAESGGLTLVMNLSNGKRA